MLKFQTSERSLVIELDGEQLLSHSPSAPLFAAGEALPEVKLNNGAWSLPAHDLPEKSLVRVNADEAHGVVRFGSPRRWLSMTVEEKDGAVVLRPEGASSSFGRLVLMLYGSPEGPIYGGGRSGDLRSKKITLWESDSIATHGETVREALGRTGETVAAPLGMFTWDDGTYVAIRCAGGIEADFTHRTRRRFEMWGMPEEIIVGRVSSTREALKRVSHIGVSRRPMPRWAIEGVTVSASGGEEELLRRIDLAARLGMRPSGVYIPDWSGQSANGTPFRDYEPSLALYPRLGEILERLRSRGIRAIARVTPQLDTASTAYHEAAKLGLLLVDRRGAPLLTNLGGMCANLDLSNPAARKWAAEKLEKHVLALGFRALEADGAAMIPAEAACLSGVSTTAMHNRWARLWLEVCGEAAKSSNATVFGANAPSFATAGKVRGLNVAWELGEGVAASFRALTGQASTGAGLCFIDADSGLAATPPELRAAQYVRCAEVAAFTPHFRLPLMSGDELGLDPSDYRIVANMAQLHNRLAPYMAVLINEYASGGLPPVRPAFLTCPGAGERQIFLGDDLVFAPVGSVESNTAEVVLPDGAWVRLLGGGDYTGGRHRVEALPGNPAAFYRRDSEHASFFRSISPELK